MTMQSPTVYSSVISPRSGRLRTIGAVLLAAVVAMTLYGYFGLMPSLERSARRNPEISLAGPQVAPGASGLQESPAVTRANRVRKLQIAVALAYWGVCALLLVAALAVAWLDFREVTRMYVSNRRAIWSDGSGMSGEPPPDVED
jgi:hypothetical protein